MSKVIRIEAKSNVYEYSAEVPEKKAEGILKKIKANFLHLQAKYSRQMYVEMLKVTTSVVNPELF